MTYRNFNPKQYQNTLVNIFDELLTSPNPGGNDLRKVLAKHTKEDGQVFSKDQLIAGFRYLKQKKLIVQNVEMPAILRMKPTRTISGVTTVTVLTKPFPCPGKCIFCPNDIRMPKSYIASEPGAQRALVNRFTPYLQVFNRLRALEKIGHPTDKIELLVLGGTWSYYPKSYQIWFIKECFKAMNDFGNTQRNNQTPLPHEGNINDTINETLRDKHGDKTYNQLINTSEYKTKFKDKIANEEKATW